MAVLDGCVRACAAIPRSAIDSNDNRGVSGEGHGHSHASAGDLLKEGSAAGIRSLRISALGLLLTSAIQFTVVAIGGSVALMADALHNLGYDGVQSVRSTIEEGCRLGLEQLTLYCLSVENWKRPQTEIDFLMSLLHDYLIAERDEIMVARTAVGIEVRLPLDLHAC